MINSQICPMWEVEELIAQIKHQEIIDAEDIKEAHIQMLECLNSIAEVSSNDDDGETDEAMFYDKDMQKLHEMLKGKYQWIVDSREISRQAFSWPEKPVIYETPFYEDMFKLLYLYRTDTEHHYKIDQIAADHIISMIYKYPHIYNAMYYDRTAFFLKPYFELYKYACDIKAQKMTPCKSYGRFHFIYKKCDNTCTFKDDMLDVLYKSKADAEKAYELCRCAAH